jgi:hypothetical protein
MLARYFQLETQFAEVRQDLRDTKTQFGKHALARLVWSNTGKIPSIKRDLLDTCAESQQPLLTIGNYGMYFVRMKDIVYGENKTFADLEAEGLITTAVLDEIEVVDKLILENVAAIWAALPKYICRNHPEFKNIIRSQKKKYIYYYGGLNNESFGFTFRS